MHSVHRGMPQALQMLTSIVSSRFNLFAHHNPLRAPTVKTGSFCTSISKSLAAFLNLRKFAGATGSLHGLSSVSTFHEIVPGWGTYPFVWHDVGCDLAARLQKSGLHTEEIVNGGSFNCLSRLVYLSDGEI